MSDGGPAADDARAAAERAVVRWCADAGVVAEPGARPGEHVVQLPGEHKLRTTVSLLVGERALRAVAFVVRAPDENAADVHRRLLMRNIRLPGIAFALDRLGDVYLVGRLPLDAVDAGSLDVLMGALLATADGSFDELLALGFASSIRREWEWRTSRGEPTDNLEAFRHLIDGH